MLPVLAARAAVVMVSIAAFGPTAILLFVLVVTTIVGSRRTTKPARSRGTFPHTRAG